MRNRSIEFATRATGKELPPDVVARVYQLRDVSERIVRAVKATKHLRRNATRYTQTQHGAPTDLYNGLRTQIARILVEINRFEEADPEQRSRLWLDDELAVIETDYRRTNAIIETMIREERVTASVATSFLNDSNYAYKVMRELLEAARDYYTARDSA